MLPPGQFVNIVEPPFRTEDERWQDRCAGLVGSSVTLDYRGISELMHYATASTSTMRTESVTVGPWFLEHVIDSGVAVPAVVDGEPTWELRNGIPLLVDDSLEWLSIRVTRASRDNP